MGGRVGFAILCAGMLIATEPAIATPPAMAVNIRAGSLSDGLQNLQRQTGIELLFDDAAVRGQQAPAVDGDLTAEIALSQLLAETDLTARRAQSGAWIVEQPTTPTPARADAALPEILILGHRTQNSDLRRIEDDVQPYKVVTRAEILGAHRDDINQFFASRMTRDTQVLPTDRSQEAQTLSALNLRGLGVDGTLVLIDGRRMPRIPNSSIGFTQSDLNPIPLHAIKRIEVLTGAAGGIYGFGALGGVVNVVLDRDTRGLDLHLTEGISSRGDSQRHGVEAAFGHTWNDGATDLVLSAAHSQVDTPLIGSRRYAVRERGRALELAPDYFPIAYPSGNSVAVRSLSGTNLAFKPEFGGAPLSSDHTFLPTGFSGDAAALVARLTQHDGETDFSLPPSEAAADLGSNPRSDALFANLRHRFAAGWEAYLDAILLRSRGDSNGDPGQIGLANGQSFIDAESPANPFDETIIVGFPLDGIEMPFRKHVETTRYSAGLIADLPSEWRGTAQIGYGGVHHDASASIEANPGASLLFLSGDPSDLGTNPLGDWSAFQRAIAGGRTRYRLSDSLHSRYREMSLRLAGPVFSREPNPPTLTLLAEHRTEAVPEFSLTSSDESEGTTSTYTSSVASRRSRTNSLYAEVRAPLVSQSSFVAPLRGLELQFAIRRDEEEDHFSNDPQDETSLRNQANFSSTAFTAGAKASPTPWLMLRASYATGAQPPPLIYLAEGEPQSTSLPFATDPKRGGALLGADGEYLVALGGDDRLATARASTVFFGTVLTPYGADGPRIAIDYSRIRRTRDIALYSGQDIMAHEDAWPQRVVRAPLTDADRAQGYTAGSVTLLDLRYANAASLEVEAIDLHADWPISLFGGRLSVYTDATFHLSNVQKQPFEADVHWAGFRNGPLKWRANGGFDWSTERLTLSANAQYFGSYLFLEDGPTAMAEDYVVQMQGSRRIPAQVYLDVGATWRLSARSLGDLTVSLGIVNVLDATPPRESSILTGGPGYSRYGDPRQRRFELGLSVHL